MKFRAEVELGGKTATGIAVPDEVVTALAAGRRPPVTVTVGGHSYRTTVASMGGRFMVPLSAENRAAAGVAAGDQVDVEVVGDTVPRQVTVPHDLGQALAAAPAAAVFFDGLAPSHRKEWVRWVEEAKQAQTRASRLAKTIAALQSGRRTR